MSPKSVVNTTIKPNSITLDNNRQGSAWAHLENDMRELVTDNNQELYMTAGGFDYSPEVPKLREIHNTVSTKTPELIQNRFPFPISPGRLLQSSNPVKVFLTLMPIPKLLL